MVAQKAEKPTPPPAGPFQNIFGGRPEALLDVLSRVADIPPSLLLVLGELQSGQRKFENLPAPVQAQIHDISTQVASMPGPPPKRYPRVRRPKAPDKTTADAEAPAPPPPPPATPPLDLPAFWWQEPTDK